MNSQQKVPIQKAQAGVVLVIVLMIVAVIGASSVIVIRNTSSNLERVARLQDNVQARELLNMGREWVSLILFQDLVNAAKNNREFDNFEDTWAKKITSPIVEQQKNIQMAISIEDAQGRFNINNLDPEADPDKVWFNGFIRLLIANNIPPDLADRLAYSVRDWIDKDVDVSGLGGAEDGEYLRSKTSYRAANSQLSSVGELSFINGFTAEIIADITPYLSAIPLVNQEATKININTCQQKIFTVLSPNGFTDVETTQLFDLLSEAAEQDNRSNELSDSSQWSDNSEVATVQAKHERATGPRYEGNVDKFKNDVESQFGEARAEQVLNNLYGVNSKYFIVTIHVKIDEFEIKEQMVAQRDNAILLSANTSTDQNKTRRDSIKYVSISRIL